MYLKPDGRTIFTDVKPEDVAPFVLISVHDALNFEADPTEVIGKMLQGTRLVGNSLMYKVCTGEYKGVPVSVISTGSGGPARELPMADLINFTKAHTVIDIGSAGTYQDFVELGDLTISTGEIRSEGTSKEYVRAEYPALAHHEVVMALIEAAEKLGYRYHVGVTRSDDSIYLGSSMPVRGYLPQDQVNTREYWRQTGALNVQREAAIILTLCNLFGLRGGSIRHVGRNFVTGKHKPYPYSIENAYMTALEAIAVLAEWDYDKRGAQRKYWCPSLSYEKKRK
jgi:uridine phosphorylase